MLSDLWRDFSYSARMLTRQKGFSVATVISLALGFALAAAALSVLNAYVLRSLPYPGSDRLYHVHYSQPGQREPRDVSRVDWSALDDIVDAADRSAHARFYLSDGRYSDEVYGLLVSPDPPDLQDILGLSVTLGRKLVPDDFRADAERVALIGQNIWRERFGSDPNVIGRSLAAYRAGERREPELFRIVGVLAPQTRYVRNYNRGFIELATPLFVPYQTYMVRLRPGVKPSVAEQRITDEVRRAANTFPPNWVGVRLASVHENYITGLRSLLVAVTSAAAIVLLVVFINVAILTLLRALRRQKEMAVRVALGARASGIARMLAIETFLICTAALALGVTLSTVTLRLLSPLIEERLGRPVPGGTSAMNVDTNVLLAIAAVAALIAFSLAFFPLLLPWKRRLADTLRREGRSGTDGPAMHRLRSGLIVFEVAASLALLVGCGLMIRTVMNLIHTDLGVRGENLLRFRIALPERTYPENALFGRVYDQLTNALRAETNTPFAFSSSVPFFEAPKHPVETEVPERKGAAALRASVFAVSDQYFDLLGIRIRQGRGIRPTDFAATEKVAVVSETLAQRLWPDEPAPGKLIRTAQEQSTGAPLTEWRTIVGVVSDVRQTHTDTDLSDVYIAFAQAPNRFAPLYIRTQRSAQFWLERLRAIVAGIDPGVLVTGGSWFDEDAEKQIAASKFLMSLLTGFAVFAALIVMLGIYGVTAYAAQQREREIAIRSALGATPGKIFELLMWQGGSVVAIGIAAGLFLSSSTVRLISAQLHGVRPFDVTTMALASAAMLLAGILAIFIPAKRAATRSTFSSLNRE